jgi:hypothetical protein
MKRCVSGQPFDILDELSVAVERFPGRLSAHGFSGTAKAITAIL